MSSLHFALLCIQYIWRMPPPQQSPVKRGVVNNRSPGETTFSLSCSKSHRLDLGLYSRLDISLVTQLGCQLQALKHNLPTTVCPSVA